MLRLLSLNSCRFRTIREVMVTDILHRDLCINFTASRTSRYTGGLTHEKEWSYSQYFVRKMCWQVLVSSNDCKFEYTNSFDYVAAYSEKYYIYNIRNHHDTRVRTVNQFQVNDDLIG